MISVVVVYFNEKAKIPNLLESVKNLADEIVIVNIGNKNDLIDIVDPKVKILNHEFVPYVEEIRNFAIEKASSEWVLVLDPDERITKQLGDELAKLSLQNEYVAFNIPRKNIFFGHFISHTNFWPDRQVRFFKKGKVIWTDFIHLYPKVEGKVKDLAKDPNRAIEHYGYDSHVAFIQRQNRYSTIEAKNRLKNGERFSIIQLFWRPTREFLVRFIKYQGFLDGFAGVFIVFSLMVYQIQVELKMLKGDAL